MAAIVIICLLIIQTALANKTFDITIKAFKPTGLRISIADDPEIKFVQYEVVLYNETLDYLGYVRQITFHRTNGSWIFEKLDLETRVGYVVRFNYVIGTSIYDPELRLQDTNHTSIFHLAGNGYDDTYTYKIENLEERKTEEKNKCFVISKLPNRDVCSDDIIFEENFDALNEDNWRIEQYIPFDHPEYPFVTYQNLRNINSTAFVIDGHLHIRPLLQTSVAGFDENYIYTGTLDLYSGCTGRVCKMQATGPSILPPIVSGKISSRLAFKYGTVHIRAKLPVGDWIYPEILLEPLNHRYGSLHYSSGVLKIAMARGNKELNKPKFTSNILKGGPLLNSKCKGILYDFNSKETFDGRSWGDDFHVYSVTWSPGSIEMLVDGKSWVSYRPGSGGLRSWLPKSCRGNWYKLLDRKEGTAKIAPFDDYIQINYFQFFVSLGVAVGGVSEFPDDLATGDGKKKPWSNKDPRALVEFWEKKQDWLHTWSQPELIVDYVKVIAV